MSSDSRPSAIVSVCVGEIVDVLLDPLLRIVGSVADQLHPVVYALAQPVADVDAGQPPAPADRQVLAEPKTIYGHYDVDEDEPGTRNSIARPQKAGAFFSCSALKKRRYQSLNSFDM